MSAASILSPIREEARSYSLPAERATATAFFVADTLALLAAYTIAIALRGAAGGAALWPNYVRLAPFLAVVPLLISLMDLYPGVMLNPVEELRRLTMAISLGMSLVVVATFLTKEANVYSRLVFAGAIPLAVVLDLGARWLVRKFCPSMSWWGIPTVLVGPTDETEVMRRLVEARPAIGLRIMGVIHADRARMPLRAGEFVECGEIPYALVIIPSGADTKWVRNAERLVWGCKKIIVVPQSLGLLWSGMHIRDCCGSVGLAVRRHLLEPGSRRAKRALDFAAALGGGMLILPGVALIAALVKLSSRGPVFYGHERIGEGGRTFRAWKFRTMVQSADHLLEKYLESNPERRAEWAAHHKLKSDPRVTKIGRFLRQTSLDELPQIWNVIRGEMSLVGPRPIVREEAVKYGEELDLYGKVRPGITGLWQVSGRSDTSYEGRVAMDVHYVRNWSVWLDVYLLARTVGVVLRRQGAY
jgi:Undecaprenyl-phosphate galactose phosphotransferase WbaP